MWQVPCNAFSKKDNSLHILVSGGCGFIGPHIARHLLAKGYNVSVLDNLVRHGGRANIAVLEHDGISFLHRDIRNPEVLRNLPLSIELICDGRGQPLVVTGYANLPFDITHNGLGTIYILEYAQTRRIRPIFWSCNRVYGTDRLNALPRRDTASFEDELEVWHHLPVDQRPAGFDPVYGISEQFSIDGGQRSIYNPSQIDSPLVPLRWE